MSSYDWHEWWRYFAWSMLTHLGLLVLVFGGIYRAVFVNWKEHFFQFKFNSKYPPLTLVRTEIWRCVCSLCIVSTLDTIIYASAHTGGLPLLSWNQPAGLSDWLPAVSVLLWADFHFYFMHRTLHEVPWLYRNVHKVHHESYNPNPFSGLSFHPIEASLYFSAMLAVCFIPMPYWVYQGFKFSLVLSPIGGHVGHGAPEECGVLDYITDFRDHYVHHEKFNYNFGSGVFPRNGIWDNLLGTAYKHNGPKDDKRALAAQVQANVVGETVCS
eukprot:TRINITY_DN20199_c0_g2_i1.p1 TRINITY_DN20199_c0_g2~~TRINITY_DN20199_c0_g2_i1.p1  ORF type:complete len:270 (+),score=43.11 TRINITY_DN20199_c0_g2_i1:56-865(+)